MAASMADLVFFVNGREVKKKAKHAKHVYQLLVMQVVVPQPDPEMTLLYFIRNNCILRLSL